MQSAKHARGICNKYLGVMKEPMGDMGGTPYLELKLGWPDSFYKIVCLTVYMHYTTFVWYLLHAMHVPA